MKVIKNYTYNVIYQIFVLIIPLVTMPYVSRVLGSEGIGINAYTNSVITYFILFGSIGVNMYGNRAVAYVREDIAKLTKIFWEITFLKFITIGMSYIIFMFFLYHVQNYRSFYLYQSILIIAAGVDISWFFMGMEEFKKIVLRNIIIKIVSLLSIFIFVKTQDDIGLYICILATSTLLGNLVLWSSLSKFIRKPAFKSLNVIRHLGPTIALFIPQIAMQMYFVLNKTMLGYLTNIQNVGYYENADKIIKIVLTFATSISTVMLPRMANLYSRGDLKKIQKYLINSFDFVSAICFPMAFGLSAIAPKFSVWFFGSQFLVTGELIPILSIIIIFMGWGSVLGDQYLLPTNKTKYYTITVTTGAIVNVVMNILLIIYFDIYGTVYAIIISEAVVVFTQLLFINKTMDIRRLFFGTWKYLSSSIIMFVIIKYLNNVMQGNVLNFLFQVLIGSIIYLSAIILIKAPILNTAKTLFKR